MSPASRLQRAWLSRGALAIGLLPLAAAFSLVTGLRRTLYQRGWLRIERIGVPVVVVGNLIAGGAGKTPSVIAIAALLGRHGFTPGIVSRGYGGRFEGVLDVLPETPAVQCGDEPLLMRRRTGVPVVVGRNRVDAGRHLMQCHPTVDVVISDDGLQHLALARDAQVLVFDERGAGNGWLLPAGPLRERSPQTMPSHTLVLYNAARASTPLDGTCVRRSLTGVLALRDWEAGRNTVALPIAALIGRPLLAAAGIAQPARFFQMLRDRGLSITPLPLPDHHPFDTLPWAADTADVVLTEKDATKLLGVAVGNTRVWVAPLDFELDAGFAAALIALLPPPGHRHGNTPA